MRKLLLKVLEPILRWTMKDIEKVLCALEREEWMGGYYLYKQGVTKHHRVYPLLQHLVETGYAEKKVIPGLLRYNYRLTDVGVQLKLKLESGELSKFPL